MNNPKRRFVRQGDKLVIKQDIKPEELDAKSILDSLRMAETNMARGEAQLVQMQEQQKTIIGNLENVRDLRDEFKKHEDWATTIQLSKLKALLPEAEARAEAKVLGDYSWDTFITDEQNVMQMERQLQQYVGRDEEIGKLISADIIKKHVFEKSLVTKKWSDMPIEEVKALLKK